MVQCARGPRLLKEASFRRGVENQVAEKLDGYSFTGKVSDPPDASHSERGAAVTVVPPALLCPRFRSRRRVPVHSFYAAAEMKDSLNRCASQLRLKRAKFRCAWDDQARPKRGFNAFS
jgi:hypothetical protein